MNKKEYINEITKNIKSRREKEEVRRELECHLEDREQFYLGAGYDEKTAESKTLQKMGDAEQIGQSLGRLHSRKSYIILFSAFLICALLCSAVIYLLTLAGSRLFISSIISEFLYTLICLIFAFTGLKKGYKSLALGSLIFFVLATAESFLTLINLWGAESLSEIFSSGIACFEVYLFSAKIEDFAALESSVYVKRLSMFLMSVSAFWYVIIIALLLLCFLLARKTSALQCTKKDRKNKKRLISVLCCFIAVTAVLFGANEFCVYNYALKGKDILSVFMGESSPPYIIAVSDSKTSLEELPEENKLVLYAHSMEMLDYPDHIHTESYDKTAVIFEDSNEYSEQYLSFDKNIKYKVRIFEAEIKTDKKYYYLSLASDPYSESKWKECGAKAEIITPYSVIGYKLTITKEK